MSVPVYNLKDSSYVTKRELSDGEQMGRGRTREGWQE